MLTGWPAQGHAGGSRPALAASRAHGARCPGLVTRRRVVAACSGSSSNPAAADAAPDEQAAAEAAAKAGWDPEGLFGATAPLTGNLFARRQQKQQPQASGTAPPATVAAASGPAADAASAGPPSSGTAPAASSTPAAAASGPDTTATATATSSDRASPGASTSQAPPARAFSDPLVSLPDARAGALPAAQPAGSYHPAAYAQLLADKFMAVDLQRPGVRVHHLDPPVITIDDFFPRELCQQLMAAADASGCLQASRVGAGNAGSGASNAYDARRTSSSMLVDPGVRRQHAELAGIMDELQRRAWELLLQDGGKGWGAAGRMPAAGQYCYESPQVARYEQGQHFLSHEDAFPAMLARRNGFNRHATLLVYLNDVQQGGRTCFDHLGIAVQPQQGKALLFFPAYSDGRPDERTLHTAEPADHLKWVTQQWIARGYGKPKGAPKAAASKGRAGKAEAPAAGVVLEQEVLTVPVGAAGGSQGKKQKGGKKGGGGGGSRGFG